MKKVITCHNCATAFPRIPQRKTMCQTCGEYTYVIECLTTGQTLWGNRELHTNTDITNKKWLRQERFFANHPAFHGQDYSNIKRYHLDLVQHELRYGDKYQVQNQLLSLKEVADAFADLELMLACDKFRSWLEHQSQITLKDYSRMPFADLFTT